MALGVGCWNPLAQVVPTASMGDFWCLQSGARGRRQGLIGPGRALVVVHRAVVGHLSGVEGGRRALVTGGGSHGTLMVPVQALGGPGEPNRGQNRQKHGGKWQRGYSFVLFALWWKD